MFSSALFKKWGRKFNIFKKWGRIFKVSKVGKEIGNFLMKSGEENSKFQK